VVGVIGALEETGATVERFIVGDHMPRRVRVRSERLLQRGPASALVADVARISLGAVNGRRAWRALGGRVDWVYERAAALQSLGWSFRRRGVPWILETSSPVFYEAKAERASLVLGGLARRRELAAYRRCDVVVCVSRELQAILAEEGVDERKMIVMPNGVDVGRFDPEPHRAAPRAFPGFTIGFVGTMSNWQGLALLLEAVVAVRARGLDVAVALAGDGSERAACERTAAELGLADHVRFAGRLPGSAVPGFLAGVDVAYSGQTVLGRGRMYHSPLKLYEYMAMEKPVVASAFDDARSLVEEGVTGFLFRPGDVADLQRAIAAAYAARPRLAALGREARRRIVAEHSWRARIDAMHAAIERL
jgi:glycosyltransferase involved in cell wall biosynthesis